MIEIINIDYAKNNVVVTLSTGELVKLPREVALNYFLYVGKTFAAKTLVQMQAEGEQYKGYAYALNVLSRQMYSEKEIRDKLKKREIPALTISNIIKKLTDNILLDDQKYAQVKVDYMLNAHKKSKQEITRFLRSKGINHFLIEDTLALFVFDEKAQITKKVALLMHSVNQLSFAKAREKIYTKLLSQGYSSEDILSVLNLINFANYIDEAKNIQTIIKKVITRKNLKSVNNFDIMYNELRKKGYPHDLVVRMLKEWSEDEN